MEELNWSYFNSDCPPTKDRLRETIEGLIDHLEEDEDASVISSGGFRITDKDEENAYLIEFIADTQWIEKQDGER
jgi:hypothetical protein